MPDLPVLSHDAVLAAISPEQAIEHVHEALVRHQVGAWDMPAKTYLDCPPYGDFRAMPAHGDGLALIKWICSFPGNPRKGLPTVMGLVCLSDATTGMPLMLLSASAVTALRTGAAAAIASTALARREARTVGIVGCGLNGAWTARCVVAAGYGPGTCFDVDDTVAARLAGELGNGWRAGSRQEAVAQDVVCCVTPGAQVVIEVGDLHPGAHLNMLGADSHDKAEASVEAVAKCVLYCDEWEQASHGGELSGAIEAGLVSRDQVTEIGAVLSGITKFRREDTAVTMFDSTGLAIQDLAIARAALSAWRQGDIEAQTVSL